MHFALQSAQIFMCLLLQSTCSFVTPTYRTTKLANPYDPLLKKVDPSMSRFTARYDLKKAFNDLRNKTFSKGIH